VTGTLADLTEKTPGIQPPALLIVGDVVRLREQIDWFDPQLPVIAMKAQPDEAISYMV
jgi:uroporphyrin-III C-methyltransferase